MKYSNPLPPEGINTSATHPLKEFALLTGGLIALVVVFVAGVELLAGKFAPYIPFKTEVAIASELGGSMPEEDPKVEAWLQALAEKMAATQNLPGDLSVTVHYVNNDTVNAMATLGGNIIVYRGLLEKLKSENAIAMVLGHEIAHVHHRDPIRALGAGAIVSLALSAAGLSTGDAGSILGNSGLLTVLAFSRHQEQQADQTALLSLYHYYGHVNGAIDVFKVLLKQESGLTARSAFFSDHPLTEKRIDNVIAYAHRHHWPLHGKLVPVPKAIREDLAADASKDKSDSK